MLRTKGEGILLIVLNFTFNSKSWCWAAQEHIHLWCVLLTGVEPKGFPDSVIHGCLASPRDGAMVVASVVGGQASPVLRKHPHNIVDAIHHHGVTWRVRLISERGRVEKLIK